MFDLNAIGDAAYVAGTAAFRVPVTLPDGAIGHFLCGPGPLTHDASKEVTAEALNARVDVFGASDVLDKLRRGDLRLDALV